ncbi:hypothetical protein A2U01_0064910, partial [Trifolium medium]|nr:hypothetical protein [Trifolium medium]
MSTHRDFGTSYTLELHRIKCHRDFAELTIKEFHRRDGFEVASADKIFESTSKEQ